MKPFAILMIIAFAIGAAIFAPLIAMWSIDTLFGTHIPVTFKTWFAMFLLLGAAHGSKIKFKSNS